VKYVNQIIYMMNMELNRIIFCIDQLSEEQLWHRFKPNMNSVGNLCLHLAGNEYQHFVSGIGGKSYIRQRTSEFTSNGSLTKDKLKELLVNTRNQTIIILQELTEEDMSKSVKIEYSIEDWNNMLERSPEGTIDPGYESEIELLLCEVCEHYGYHSGQIVLLTKLLKDIDHSITGYKH